MAYSTNDIVELIRYHLVVSADDDAVADRNLSQLKHDVDQMITTPHLHETLYWMVCEECGAWVSSELIAPEGAGEGASGAFYCTSCRFGDEET